jgi:hypothetical protein
MELVSLEQMRELTCEETMRSKELNKPINIVKKQTHFTDLQLFINTTFTI